MAWKNLQTIVALKVYLSLDQFYSRGVLVTKYDFVF